MSGQPTPPRIVEAFAKNATVCTPAAPVPGGKTSPFPAPTQTGVTPGAASLFDGFPPLNMTDPLSGGVPPFGVDMNGILYLLSSWVAFLGAGQLPLYDATLQTAMSGYAQGAVLQQAADATATWTSSTAANVTDPDTGGAGWISSKPLFATVTPTAGAHNNVVLPGPSDYVLAVDTTAGASDWTGIVAQRDGQRLTFVVTGANNFTLDSLNAGSTTANRIQVPTDISLVTNQSFTIQYSTGLTKWVQA